MSAMRNIYHHRKKLLEEVTRNLSPGRCLQLYDFRTNVMDLYKYWVHSGLIALSD